MIELVAWAVYGPTGGRDRIRPWADRCGGCAVPCKRRSAVSRYIPVSARKHGVSSDTAVDVCPGPTIVEGFQTGGVLDHLFRLYTLADGNAAALPAILGGDPSAMFLEDWRAAARAMTAIRDAAEAVAIERAKRGRK